MVCRFACLKSVTFCDSFLDVTFIRGFFAWPGRSPGLFLYPEAAVGKAALFRVLGAFKEVVWDAMIDFL